MQIKPLPHKLLEETIGIPLEIKSNEFNEISGIRLPGSRLPKRYHPQTPANQYAPTIV